MPPPIGNLPAEPNGFVGRERDLRELARLIERVRALTLCGPGGIGKTRLAVRLAADLAPRFADGAWLADLSAADIPGQAVTVVAEALGIRGDPDRPLLGSVVQALRGRSALLILDTCEHVVDAAAELAAGLMAGCPGLRLIVTSREPLRVRGETVWRVPPLAPPPDPGDRIAGGRDVTGMGRYDSVRLFAERLAAVRPGFTLDEFNAPAIARVCRRLDGVPLALELAAACARSLSAEQLAERLDDQFAMLALGDRTAPPRQQTLLATVEWSYGLLTEPERVLLRRLSVFRGWSLEMAERVCADELLPAGDILALLTGLIDKSLVIGDGELDGHARYQLLEAVRQYAAGRAAAAGELPALRAAHAALLIELLEEIAGQAFACGGPAWPERLLGYRRVLAERPNCRTALRYLTERRDAETGLRFCSALTASWVGLGRSATGAERFDRFLALDQRVPSAILTSALANRAELAFDQRDYRLAAELARSSLDLAQSAPGCRKAPARRLLAQVALREGRDQEALGLAEEAGLAARGEDDQWEQGVCLAVGAAALMQLGQLAEAESRYRRALARLRDNHAWGIAQIRFGLGQVAASRGDHAAAISHFEVALELYGQLSSAQEQARCQVRIGFSAFVLADLETARSSLLAALDRRFQAGGREGTAPCLALLGLIAAAGSQLPEAIRLLGAAGAAAAGAGGTEPGGTGAPGGSRARSGSRVRAESSRRSERLLEQARRRLGTVAVDELLAAGHRLGPEEATRLAAALPLRPDGRPGLVPSAGGPAQSLAAAPDRAAPGTSPLTGRELEVARLVATGMSNGEIGQRLGIAMTTVARHVANVFGKLGFSSRAQLAAWVVADPLAGPAEPAGEPGATYVSA